MHFQNNNGTPPIAELTAALFPKYCFEEAVFRKDVVVCPTPDEVISKLGSSTSGKKRLRASKKSE